jgi:uncharacterized protein YcbX
VADSWQLSEINVYPVKGCRRTALREAVIGRRGLAGDREWMVVRPDGTFLTQRTHPALARIVPTLDSGRLTLRCEGCADLVVDAVGARPAVTVSVWRQPCEAFDAGEAAAEWLSRALGDPVRLVQIAPDSTRMANREFVGERDVPVAFADGYPLLVCSVASLAELNRRLETPVPMERFRPNLVLTGLTPFAEDQIGSLRVGAVRLSLVKPCTRCTVPSIDQITGQPSTDPVPALKSFRFDRTLRGVTFGMNAVAEDGVGKTLATGMAAVAG